MNYIDAVLLFILIIFLLLGVRRGFVLSLIQLIGIGIIVLFIQQFGNLMRSGIHEKLGVSEGVAMVLGYIIIIVLVMILAKIVTALILKFMKIISLGWIDKLLGGFLGLIFGIIFIVLIVLIVEISSSGNGLGDATSNSKAYNTAKNIAGSVLTGIVNKMPGYHPETHHSRRPIRGQPI